MRIRVWIIIRIRILDPEILQTDPNPDSGSGSKGKTSYFYFFHDVQVFHTKNIILNLWCHAMLPYNYVYTEYKKEKKFYLKSEEKKYKNVR